MAAAAGRVAGGRWAALGVAALGIGTYGAMDAVMKGLALGMGAYAALFWRMVAGVVLTGALYLAARAPWPRPAVIRVHAARSVIVAIMALAFFWGIARVPLAEAVALSFIAPLIALALAALVLKERVGWRAVAASVIGLAGVAVILAGRLGGTHAPDAPTGMAAVLVSAVFYAINLVMARHQAQLARPLEIAFFQNTAVLLILGLGAPWLVALPAPATWGPIAGAGALAVVSLLLMSWAYARAEAQALLSVEYTAFVWAALLGWWVFGEPLTLVTVAGTALIVTGCLLAATARGGPALPEAEAAA
jgi:S-adenosylmethionine uptake transporter